MHYWLWVTTYENWKITENTKIIGISNRFRTTRENLKIGDEGLVYIKQRSGHNETPQIKKSVIIAHFKIVSEFYEDNKKLFNMPENNQKELFPLRFKITILKKYDNPIVFKNLIGNLDFIKNKTRWGMHLMGKAIIQISEKDFEYIVTPK